MAATVDAYKDRPTLRLNPSAPAVGYRLIVPNNATEQVFRGFKVVTDGTFHVVTYDGTEITYPADHFTLKALEPIALRKIFTDSTAVVWGYV